MEYQKVSSAPFSRKLINGRSFSGTNIYDGVFSGPMKVGSPVKEDFGEIFRGSISSSIPVLDVPELNERKISVDVNSSELDYLKIFGGFGEFDFAVSHEEISFKSKKRDIKEAREPAPGSHTSNFSVENHVLSHEASFQSFDGVKQFKMSYHKANQERKNGTNGPTHVTQLHAVPGYTCLIDDSASSKNTEGDKPLSSVLNGSHLKTNFSGEITEGKHSRKASSVHSPDGASKQASLNGVNIQNKFNHCRSNSNDVFFDAFEIGLKTHHSKVLPRSCGADDLGTSKSNSKTSRGSKTGISNSHSTEGATGVSSPPYFDEEIDTNSVAAASAAALKKAIENAQAKIKIAKEIMERKKDGLQNHVKLGFNDGPKVDKRREGKTTDQTNKFREEEWQKCRKGDAPMQVFAKEMHNAMKAGKVGPDFRGRDGQLFAEEASHGAHGNEYNSTKMDHRQEEMEDLKAEKLGGVATKLVQSINDFELKERFFTMKETGKKLKAFEETHEHEAERMLNAVQGACELKEDVCEPKSDQEAHDQEEYGKKSMVSGLQEGKEVTLETSPKLEAPEKKQRRLWDLTGNNLVTQPKDNEHTKMRMLKEEQAWFEREKKQEEVLEQKESDIISEDFPQTEENEAALEEIFNPEENGKRDEATCKKVEFEKQQKESFRLEENEECQEDVHGREDAEKAYDKAQEQENVNGFHGGEHSGNKLEDDSELGAKVKLIEANENDKRLEESHELGETEEIQREIDETEEDEKMKITRVACEHFKNNHEVANNVSTQDKTVCLSKTLETSVHDENNPFLVAPTHEENGRLTEVSQASSKCKEMETESNVVDLAKDQEEKRILEVEIAGLAQVVLELQNEIQKQVKDTTMDHASEPHELNIGVSDIDLCKKSGDQHKKEFDKCYDTGNCVEESTSESEENFEEVEEALIQGEDKSNSQFPHEERWIDNGENVEATREENFEEVEEAMKQGEDASNSEFSLEEKWIDNEENVEATQQGKEESTDSMHNIKTNQRTVHKEEHSDILKTVVREDECTMQREVGLEKAHERKLDEAKDKEREREKERIAVERAIREARERAFIEARERAERAAVEKANAEARQRAMADARERLEKATAEVNDKSTADKISMEAILKAERAAVERATAEARVRALEKAMSEKATLQRRNEAVKSSIASRENGTRHSSASNDSQYKGSGPSRDSVYPKSSNHEVPHSTNKSDAVNGESIQKHKARMESHQRITERAAKALAEKNLRDQLVREEKAERNRLAGVLDAEVRRWSSGKVGNLRALLSTLQYILGPDSGWQAVPLTDLIASAAVKKAYRKATLCVHPDKLQQRGASIQQKYTCEKVFDLLKEAWNKFNAEER